MGRRGTAIGIVTALSALVLTGCGAQDQAAARPASIDKVTVGVIPIVDVAPVYLGKKMGFFEEQRIELTPQIAESGATIIPTVAAGEYQFGFSNVTSLMLARDQKTPLKIVAAGDSSTGKVGADVSAVMVSKGSPISRPADLAGRKVAVNAPSNIGTTTISKVVRDDGGDPTTIEFVVVAFPDMPEALATKKVDAAWMVEPLVTAVTAKGATAVAWPFAGTDPNLMIAAYFTSESLIAKNPDLVKRFTTAMNASLAYAQANPMQTRAVLTEYTKTDAATANALVLPKYGTKINGKSLTLLRKLAVKDGWMDEQTGPEPLLP